MIIYSYFKNFEIKIFKIGEDFFFSKENNIYHMFEKVLGISEIHNKEQKSYQCFGIVYRDKINFI